MTGVYYFLLLQQLTSVPSPNVANMAAMIRGIWFYILLLFYFCYFIFCYFNFCIDSI